MNVEIEVVNKLTNVLLSEMEGFNIYSKVPKINTSAFYMKTFNDFMLEDWTPLFVKVVDVDKQEVIGIVPLMYKTIYRRRFLPYKIIKFFGSTFSDFHDIYARDENKDIVINSFLNWLFKSKFSWQELILDDLLESSNIIQSAEKYLKKNNRRYNLKAGKYFHINLDRSWDEVKKDTSKSYVWKNVRLAKNRITKAGTWDIEYNPEISTEEIIKRAKPIHIERQSVLGRKSRFEDENYLKALDLIINNFKKQSQFNTYWLKFNNQYIAYMLGFYIDNTFYWWSTAFLDEFKEFYPTRLLQYHVMEYMHEKNYKEFNFMRGESGYKDKWTKSTRANYRLRVYNNKSTYGKFLGIFDANFKR